MASKLDDDKSTADAEDVFSSENKWVVFYQIHVAIYQEILETVCGKNSKYLCSCSCIVCFVEILFLKDVMLSIANATT